MSHDTPSGNILRAQDPYSAALTFAERDNLPMGARIEVRDMDDRPVNFIVERSNRSQGMLDGGRAQVRRVPPPLRGGGAAADADEDEADHIVHARTMAQAALLYAKEAGLTPGSYVRVEHPQNGQGVYFRTPQ